MIKKVLVIGSGPIIIGQSAEFDYSGAQACRSLREENIEVVLVNSNPATIQTDTEVADRVYIEPLEADVIAKIIENEKPDGIIATMGGQMGLNLAMELRRKGILDANNLRFLGTDADSIEMAESRESFKNLMAELNVPVLPGKVVRDLDSAKAFAKEIGYPVIARPSFTLGGTGGGSAKDESELERILQLGFSLSATGEVLIEKSGIGWGEFEYEVIRDGDGNAIIICSMENIDPMGIHTGESIVAAPAQTLSDRDHQRFRDTAIKIADAVGIKGGCNVQFAMNQETGEYVVIEINPRLSRSSALASKATGYPIARVATKIALGKKLHEIKNAITGTSAAFEPALDYVVLKIPRWPFDKFARSDRRLGTMMKSTGETMAIGRSFEESLMKAIESTEVKIPKAIKPSWHLYPATDQRLFAIFEAFRRGETPEDISRITMINSWFLRRIRNLVEIESELKNGWDDKITLSNAKENGFPDRLIASIAGITEPEVRKKRKELGIMPVFKQVDSCAGEFEALTPYYYSTYGTGNEAVPEDKKKVLVLGSGPIRIGQGVEFDYCCSHAAIELSRMDICSIMVNNNPETVSTDFDTSDRLYFEPLSFERVMDIIENETPYGVILQLGGQTSINLAKELDDAGVNILGTSKDSLDLAEDRERFRMLCQDQGILQPQNGTATSQDEALMIAEDIGYPVVVRPSYVIAGRGMAIVRNKNELSAFLMDTNPDMEKPLLIDKYLDNAIEAEVDAVSDSKNVLIGGIMEHIEPAGIHSGDANIVVPSVLMTESEKAIIRDYTERLARSLKTVGLLNIQYAVKEGKVYVLEANPRASRTIPFLSKAAGIPMMRLAIRAMLGQPLDNSYVEHDTSPYAVKSVVFPFLKLAGTDTVLGPEMRSTGETMGISDDFELAYLKALSSSGMSFSPKKGSYIFMSLRDEDKKFAKQIAEAASAIGMKVCGTRGTISGIDDALVVNKIGKGSPDVLQTLKSGDVSMVINTPSKGGLSHTDGYKIRRLSLEIGVPCLTSINTALRLLHSLLSGKEMHLKTIDEWSS